MCHLPRVPLRLQALFLDFLNQNSILFWFPPEWNVSDLKKSRKSGPAKTQNLSPCPNGTSLSYENFAAGFIAKNCLACHSQNLTNDFRAVRGNRG